MSSARDTVFVNNRRHSTGRRRPDDTARHATKRDTLTPAGVTFRVRRLEPWVAWVFAGFALWLNIVLNVTGMAFWLIVFFAACVGGWSRMFPARQQAGMFTRAVLLLFGALLLQLSAGTGAEISPYAFLAPLTLAFYLLLLTTPWAVALVLLHLMAFGLVVWLVLVPVPWRAVLAHAGFLLAIAPVALQFGRALRLSEENTESSLRDHHTQLYNETGFFVHGAVLLAECRQAERPFCMVLLNGADLLDIPGLLGRRVANDLFAQVVRGIGTVSGEGIAARTESAEFGLMLPGVNAERAAALIRQHLGDPPKVEVQLDGKTIAVVLDLAIAQALDQAQSVEDLYDGLHAVWSAPGTAAAASGKTPAKVPILGPDDERTVGRARPASPTVPMPLRAQRRPWDT